MTENVMITSKQNFYGTEVLIGYSKSRRAFGSFAYASYVMLQNKKYPAVILSIPATILCNLCPNVMAWIIGHEVGHILNGDLDNVTSNAYGIADYEERMNGEIPEKEFNADRVGWDICTEEERKGVIEEFPYMMLVFKANWPEDYQRVRKEFDIRTHVLGFGIRPVSKEELEVFAKKYDALRKEYIRVRGLTA